MNTVPKYFIQLAVSARVAAAARRRALCLLAPGEPYRRLTTLSKT